MGNVSLTMFRMGSDGVRHAFGKYHGIPFTPYIHSFSVTQDYVIVLVYPTAYNMFCMMQGHALHGCMDWKGATIPTQVLVFDLHNTADIDPHKPPIGVSTTAAFHSQHHINAYQEAGPDGGTRLVV